MSNEVELITILTSWRPMVNEINYKINVIPNVLHTIKLRNVPKPTNDVKTKTNKTMNSCNENTTGGTKSCEIPRAILYSGNVSPEVALLGNAGTAKASRLRSVLAEASETIQQSSLYVIHTTQRAKMLYL